MKKYLISLLVVLALITGTGLCYALTEQSPLAQASIMLTKSINPLSSNTPTESTEKVATIVTSPLSGNPGAKLTIYGSCFEPGEEVQFIMEIEGVTLRLVKGGIVVANEFGAFKASSRFTMYIEPNIYTILASGNKGSTASAPIEILKGGD